VACANDEDGRAALHIAPPLQPSLWPHPTGRKGGVT
jgi:hypothetical protein